MKATDIIIGKRYELSGDIVNGRNSDGTQRLTHENVVGKVVSISSTRINCECGRSFVINENLKVNKVNY